MASKGKLAGMFEREFQLCGMPSSMEKNDRVLPPDLPEATHIDYQLSL
ncbi:hypothetical protein M2371_003452 [Buttiauxella sp. BIGb0471]|nr:hypothetical protein [Buttiauxella sp. BIGb0471]